MAICLDPDIRNPRAARFLGDLGAAWCLPVLLEAMRQAPNKDSFVIAVREALATLAEPGPGTVRARVSERP